jgi:hypothetical protein
VTFLRLIAARVTTGKPGCASRVAPFRDNHPCGLSVRSRSSPQKHGPVAMCRYLPERTRSTLRVRDACEPG